MQWSTSLGYACTMIVKMVWIIRSWRHKHELLCCVHMCRVISHTQRANLPCYIMSSTWSCRLGRQLLQQCRQVHDSCFQGTRHGSSPTDEVMLPRVVGIDSKGNFWVGNHPTITSTQRTIYNAPLVHRECVRRLHQKWWRIKHYQTMEILRRNYANKALKLLANIHATLPNNVMLHASSHTTTLSTHKRIGSILQMMEHYNL